MTGPTTGCVISFDSPMAGVIVSSEWPDVAKAALKGTWGLSVPDSDKSGVLALLPGVGERESVGVWKMGTLSAAGWLPTAGRTGRSRSSADDGTAPTMPMSREDLCW